MNKKFQYAAIRSVHALLQHMKNSFDDIEGFRDRSFYAEPMIIATLSLLGEDSKWQKSLRETFERRESVLPSRHNEFHYYALQIANMAPQLLFFRWFVRQVSNWVLLRAVVLARSPAWYHHFYSAFLARLILKINRHNGFITDNSLRMYYLRQQSVSTQYHAFATMLVGELALETQSSYYWKEFLKCIDSTRSLITLRGEIEMTGRGRRQLLGYAATLYSCALAYHYTLRNEYLRDFEKIFFYVSSWQEVSGNIPLVLSQSNLSNLTYDYNNALDYLSFWGLCVVRSVQLLSSNRDTSGK